MAGLPPQLVGQPDGVHGDIDAWMRVFESGRMMEGWEQCRRRQQQMLETWNENPTPRPSGANTAEPASRPGVRNAAIAFIGGFF